MGDADKERREVFNSIAYHVISYVESLEHVTDVKFQAEQGLTRHEAVMWEKLNFPYKLPQDLRGFYELFNGVSLSWGTECAGRRTNVATMRLNSIKDFARLPLDSCDISQIGRQRGGAAGKPVAAFLLDSSPRFGQVAVVYRSLRPVLTLSDDAANSGGNAASGTFQHAHEVWLQDLSCQWQYVCEGFTDYFRLMILHLGISGWQNAFSSAGMDPVTQQWMRLFCPERLAVDEAGRLFTDDDSMTRQQQHPSSENLFSLVSEGTSTPADPEAPLPNSPSRPRPSTGAAQSRASKAVSLGASPGRGKPGTAMASMSSRAVARDAGVGPDDLR